MRMYSESVQFVDMDAARAARRSPAAVLFLLAGIFVEYSVLAGRLGLMRVRTNGYH